MRLGRKSHSALIQYTRQISQSRVDMHFSHTFSGYLWMLPRIWASSPCKLGKADMASFGAVQR
jgi:hypothetical protein